MEEKLKENFFRKKKTYIKRNNVLDRKFLDEIFFIYTYKKNPESDRKCERFIGLVEQSRLREKRTLTIKHG